MSTYYLPRIPILFDVVKGLKLEGAYETETESTTVNNACITDGANSLWAARSRRGYTTFARFGLNFVEDILSALSDHFDTEFVSEHEEEDFQEILEDRYPEDFIVIPAPTDDNPGPWKKLYPRVKR